MALLVLEYMAGQTDPLQDPGRGPDAGDWGQKGTTTLFRELGRPSPLLMSNTPHPASPVVRGGQWALGPGHGIVVCSLSGHNWPVGARVLHLHWTITGQVRSSW